MKPLIPIKTLIPKLIHKLGYKLIYKLGYMLGYKLSYKSIHQSIHTSITKKLHFPIVFIIILALLVESSHARKLRYKEEFYNLYYLPQLYENHDLARNLHWLQVALKVPFAPPIQALIPHENEAEYEKYKVLVNMHLHYLLTKNWVFLAARFDKHRPVFFNIPYKEDILKSLDIAEVLYKGALESWNQTLEYFEVARTLRPRSKLDFLETTVYKIQKREIDYTRVITRKLNKLARTRAYFLAAP
ncbi:hypothetical protein COTS27_00222 [Spirochaetota bacterium]|nr:hypothetical protein COTS27_00222 [Spirochaetota bacterium]